MVNDSPQSGDAPPPVRDKQIRVVAVVVLLGVVLTGLVSWTTHRIDRDNERALLQRQTDQAAAGLEAAITLVVSPFGSAAAVAQATDGDPARFKTYIGGDIARQRNFVHAALFRHVGARFTQITSLGDTPVLAAGSRPVVDLLDYAVTHRTSFAARAVPTSKTPHLIYCVASLDGRYVVYIERAINANRRVSPQRRGVFADLHYATYVGRTNDTAAMQVTDRDTKDLPLSGTVARAYIRFGNTYVTLETSAAEHLGDALTRWLPLITLLGGVALTAAVAIVSGQMLRRRAAAEADTRTIRTLYEQLDASYTELHDNAETLQRALLPRYNPHIPGVEIASKYVAGARGVDIGGDWYSVIQVDDDHFGFVVGDVSGHGVEAAALMGRLRFTLRAYLLEGHGPDVALEMCSRDLDMRKDGHMATVLCGRARLSDRTVTLASAGHLNPLIIADGTAGFANAPTGRPLGISHTTYETTSVTMAPGSALIAFTDGLVERRGETLDTGLERLAQSIAVTGPLTTVLDDVLVSMTPNGAEDDIAILALRWAG